MVNADGCSTSPQSTWRTRLRCTTTTWGVLRFVHRSHPKRVEWQKAQPALGTTHGVARRTRSQHGIPKGRQKSVIHARVEVMQRMVASGIANDAIAPRVTVRESVCEFKGQIIQRDKNEQRPQHDWADDQPEEVHGRRTIQYDHTHGRVDGGTLARVGVMLCVMRG